MRASFACALVCGVGLALAQTPELPETRREEVEETYHGVKVQDPYRWLEGDAEGAVTPEVAAWTSAQNAYTRAVLDRLPGRAQLEARVAELMQVDRVGAPEVARDRYVYRVRRGDEDQSKLYLREGIEGEPQLLLDPNALDAAGLISLDWTSLNHQGTLLAFGLSRAGDENSTLHVLDLARREWLADEIPNKAGLEGWLPDGRSFLYSQLRDPQDPYSRQFKLHVVGRHPRHDPLLLEQTTTTWGPFMYPSRDGRWLIVGEFTGTSSNDLWVADLEAYLRTGELVKTPIAVGEQARFGGPVHGDTLYLRTGLGAPTGRVYAVDLNDPSRERWRELIPARSDATLTDLSLARGMLVATYLENAHTVIERYDLRGKALGELELPGLGSADLAVFQDRHEAFLSYQSYDQPPTIYRVSLKTGAREVWERAEVPVDPELAEVKQVWVESKDGTKVSVFLVHKKGLALDGKNPTLLYGYGGFNISLTPRFSATLFPWLEAGGVYAVANLRGGGEYGAAWHEAGQLARKQNVFDDFYAAAEWLIAKGYTNPERLAIQGGSNGGLLTGAAVVQRPELFRAAISAVPLLDMLRYQRFLMARFWVPEYGSAEDPAQFPYLRAYSPYHNVKPGTRYPAVLLTAGENDTRVHALHARKMAAALQHATASERPILLWVDRDAGHGRGKPLSLRIRDVVDQGMFLRWQLGMLDE
ncbi:MAG: prolyl oligopeptidase family serine peptidase [Planctomycetota bacterium]